MKYYLKVFLQKILVLCLLPFRLLPIHRDRILFLSLEGGSSCEYSCSPRAFCEYLLEHVPDRYELVWLFRDPDRYAFLRESGIRTARHFTPRGIAYALTARVVITNGGYLTWFPFRRGQICINTWHAGGAYKKLEDDLDTANRATRRRMEYSASHTAAFLSGCEAFSRFEIREAFHYRGEILPIGLPRNDLFFTDLVRQKYRLVRRSLHLPEDCRLLLYAPTFRSGSAPAPSLPAQRLLTLLEEETGKEWRLLTRLHARTQEPSAPTPMEDRCLDVSDWPDTQDLLCAADLLITDYSSILWDYSLTDRPILLYTPDLADYRRERGFYLDIRDWGFPVCQTADELCAALASILAGERIGDSARHRALLGSYESGQACRSLLDFAAPYLTPRQT